jgi:phosphate transport system permease protein
MTSYGYRKFENKLFFVLSFACVIIAVVPLLSILVEVVVRGGPQLSAQFITQPVGEIGGPAGGIGPAIQGTLILIGLTGLIGIPLGIMSGIYFAEYGNNKYAASMRIFNNALTGFPSIVCGITAAILIVLTINNYPLAGAIALSFILIPIIARTTEESLKLVPNEIREASLALGVHRWRTIVSVVLPNAKEGLVTGILLALSRIAGETAPLIMTIVGSSYFFQGFGQWMDALPLRIFRDAIVLAGYPNFVAQAWGGALVLILIILGLNIGVRVASRGRLRR